ncbi:hypothetical protein CICLE_v10017409mg [Citrus x clementina]|uniref:Uncharacterized protein n=1 Tax=Citrus clementina TaxID=85681 RepID=V4U9D3_CITCL|nr:hypothetical protein CICLE_v10017409mg [Citrus x clementina]
MDQTTNRRFLSVKHIYKLIYHYFYLQTLIFKFTKIERPPTRMMFSEIQNFHNQQTKRTALRKTLQQQY